ncbi:MAG: thioredoxin-like domain-containing protein [Phototrophicaceae bacterium]
MNRRTIFLIGLVALVAIVIGIVVVMQAQDGGERYAGQPEDAAIPFAAGLDWINVTEPLTLEDLRGKVVLLDFWTYGCINCIHMIPTLDQLEAKYPDELVVIGVHSAKFDNEGQTDNLRQIVQRYEMRHPVINDNEFTVWGDYGRFGVNAWPTFVLIDPRGNVYASQAGEVPFEAFDGVIGNMVAYFDTQGELNRDPLPQIAPELESAPPRALNYPGKVTVDEDGNRLFIADSVNHRIVIAALDTYEVLDVIGNGAQGFTDGEYASTQFYKPQGMALRGDTLYIADTFNHAIRAVDLSAQTVTTVAGTGVQGRSFAQGTDFPALQTDLRSPWDLAFGDGDTLYIAMAGTHQIWELDIVRGVMNVSVGTGREAQINGRLLASELAQPSGLYYDEGNLYFADSESSTVRMADIINNSVIVVSGTLENSLFDYGVQDGALGVNRLQHPLGVTGDDNGTIYIADTYNSRIRVVSQADLITETFSGDIAGYADGALADARFNEPGGLDYADGKLYIADTNNHAVRVIDIATETVSTVTFPNPEALQIDGRATLIASNAFAGAETLDVQEVAAGVGEIVFTLNLPEGYKINDLAPSLVTYTPAGNLTLDQTEFALDDTTLTVPATFSEGDAALLAAFELYYCEAVNESLCFIERFALDVPISVTADGDASTLNLARTVTPPAVAGTLGGF